MKQLSALARVCSRQHSARLKMSIQDLDKVCGLTVNAKH